MLPERLDRERQSADPDERTADIVQKQLPRWDYIHKAMVDEIRFLLDERERLKKKIAGLRGGLHDDRTTETAPDAGHSSVALP